MKLENLPQIPPMKEIEPSLVLISDARAALSRYCWNKTQLIDAIQSAEYFINLAKKSLNDDSKVHIGVEE